MTLEVARREQAGSIEKRLAIRDLNRLGVDAIPPGWSLSSVGEACDIRSDLRLPISVEDRVQMGGPYPYYGPTGVLGHINEYRVEGEFALIGEDGDHFLDPSNKPQTVRVSGRFNVNNHAHLIAGTDKCEVEWFSYFFRNRDIFHSLTRQGANRFKLTKASLEKLPILLPPLPEQRRIAEILQAWDEAIEKLEALRAAKERRFLALRENLIRRGEAMGVPTCFGEFLTESRIVGADGATAKKITVKLYGLGAVAKENERGGGSANTKYFKRSAGQLVYSKLDFLNGAFAIIPPNLDGFETTLDLPAFDVARSVNAEWILQYLIRPEYYSNQTEMARGQRKARRISPTEFLASRIRLPERSHQDNTVSILTTAKQDIESTASEIAALQRQKRGLMQKLLTGEWRVAAEEQVNG